MATKNSLAVKYRPMQFSQVVEQDAIKQILMQELKSDNLKRCLLFTGGAGTGKCLGKDTPVMMFDKTIKLVQDVKVNDELLGPDGTSRLVTSVCTGRELMYKVILEDNSNFICNKSHILTLFNKETNNLEHINVQYVYEHFCEFNTKYFAKKYKDSNLYTFSIERLNEDNYYGFTIEGNIQSQLQNIDKCFVLGNGIITHNTTNARIYAKEVEPNKTNIIEINCADHTGVDDVRSLILEESRVKPLLGKYKIFILDEVHMLTVQSQNALLKLLEEPPAFCIYIMCTTDPQKLLGTILSRAFRYDFQLISHKGIVNRLNYILTQEKQENNDNVNSWSLDALEYIATASKGHLRDAITTLDKILSYTKDITVNAVEKVLGVTSYEILFQTLDAVLSRNQNALINCINNLVQTGMDLKLFIKTFLQFVLDVNKYVIMKTESQTVNLTLTNIPPNYEQRLMCYTAAHKVQLKSLLHNLLELNSNIRWETDVRAILESSLLLEVMQ